MPATAAVKLERERRRTAKLLRDQQLQDRVLDTLLSPNMIRLAMIAGIISYSTWACRSERNVGPVQSALALALPGLGIPMIAADAGIKDKYALAAISGAAIGYTTGQMLVGWHEAGIGPKENSLADKLQDALLPFIG